MKDMDKMLEEIASQGRYGDTMLAHINPQEAEILKALGGSGTVNPKTGLPEFWSLSVGPVSIGSDAGGISIGNTSLSSIGGGFSNALKSFGSSLGNAFKGVGNAVGDLYMDVRDPLEAAGVTVGNYFFPGSSIITSKLVSEGAKEQLNTPEFRLANLGASAYGAYDGNFANYGFNSAAEAETAYLNDVATEEAYSQAAEQAAAENAAAGWGASGTEVAQATDIAAKTGVSMKEALSYARMGLTANALLGDPLGLGGGGTGGGTTGTTGFAQVAIPDEWKSPTYAMPSAPIDLESIFSNQNMLANTQWQDLPSQNNMSFNDIFSAGQQQTPMGTPVDINQIVGSILGQTATR